MNSAIFGLAVVGIVLSVAGGAKLLLEALSGATFRRGIGSSAIPTAAPKAPQPSKFDMAVPVGAAAFSNGFEDKSVHVVMTRYDANHRPLEQVEFGNIQVVRVNES